jgi:hypothetical protein
MVFGPSDLVGIGVIIFIGLGTDRAIPGWTTYSVGILTVLFWMVLMMMFVLVFVVLGDRNTLSFLPKRDNSGYARPDRSAAGFFDTLLYMDVLEHIEDDRGELARAAGMLSPGGHVIALSPAHNGLFTPFDKVIGHYRRYTRATLRALTPPTLKPVRIEYLDSVGLLASLANRLVLRQSMPTASQIAVWDKGMVRVSKLLDPLLGYNLGKSVLGVWKRVPAG